MESSVSNSYQRPDSRASSSSINESPLTNVFAGWAKSPDKVIERYESSEATTHIDLSAIPKHLQEKAKAQVLGNCYVKICDLAILVNTSKDTIERKAVKHPRDDSLSKNNERFATARISSQGHHRKLSKQKSDDLKDFSSYNVKNVSETRLIVQKQSFDYILPQCTPIRPELEYEDTDTEPIPGPSHNYHNPNLICSVPIVSFLRKSHSIPRKSLAVYKESVTRQELNIKSTDHNKRRVSVGTQTEPQPQVEILQRRIRELELIIASSRSFQTPSPLLLKSQDDAGSALSTPPNSDSGSCTGHVEKKSKSSSSKHNPTPTKSARIIVNRLTDNDLRQYGVKRNLSLSPTEETGPKKRPRLSSFSDYEQRSSKKPEKKINSTTKVSDLFGDDSDDDATSQPPKILEKSQPLNMDDLNYDFDDDETEESRPSSVDKQKKSKETNHREKSSKSDKKEKNSEKDRRKEKERKKKDSEKTKTGEHSKSSKEKSAKASNKSGNDQAAAGNALKYKIPKLPTPSTGPGLPPMVQDGLDKFELKKGPTSSPATQTVCSRMPEHVLPKPAIVKSTDLAKVPSTSSNTVEQPVASDSFELRGKTAPTILCNPRESVKGRSAKSVNFPEQLETVRSISPRPHLQEPDRIIEVASVREKYIPIIINDLSYEPKSSPREPIKGIRPFHPPKRRIEDEKLPTFTQERGGRRFYTNSSSSSSDSADDMSNSESGEEINEILPPTDLRLTVENQTVTNRSTIIPEEFNSDPSAHESVERAVSLASTNSDEFYTTTSTVEPASMIGVAVTSDSTEEDCSPAETEEHAQTLFPKKLSIPSLAVPPSPRRQTPEPVSQVSSALVNAKSSIQMDEDSEEDDVLDLGLNDEETFAYEEEEPPPPKFPSNVISNVPAKIFCDRPSPVKIVAPLNKSNVPAVPVKPSVIQRNVIPNIANAPFVQDDLTSNRGLCFEFVRSGECKTSDTPNKKCDFSHDLDSVLDFIQYLCNKKGNIQLAYRLVCYMTNIDSPLNKSLYEPLGMRIVGTVINTIVMGNRLDHMSIALEMLCDRKLPLIRDFVDSVVKQTPPTSASVNHLVSLYERCQFVESHKMSLNSFNKVTAVLVEYSQVKNWEFICSVVETAVSYYPQSYQPTKEVLYFLFCEAHDQMRLERLCNLFSGIGPPVLVQLGQDLRRDILTRLKHFGLVRWYDAYAGLRRPMESEMHAMSNSTRPTQTQFVAPQKYPPNGMVNHPPHGPMPLVHRAQHPSLPPVHQMQPPVRQPNYRSQLPPMQPLGPQRPSLPSSTIYRPQPPTVLPVGVHRPQLPTVPPIGVHRPQLPTAPPIGVHRPQLPTAPPVGVHRPQPPTIPMGHSVNMLYPQTTPPVTHSIRDPREKLTRPLPHENGVGPIPSSPVSLASSNPAPPSHVVSPVETKKAVPFIVLEVPKPSHSLDLNLFEPESPEVEPVFQDENDEEQAPPVVVEPSNTIENELLTKFNNQNFKEVAEWYLRCYTGDRKCPMLAKLVHLIKTNPIYNGEDNNQEMSPGEIVFKILHSVCVDDHDQESPKALEPRQQQALFDLIFFILYHFFQKFTMTNNEDEKITQAHLAKNFLELLVFFQHQLPMDDVIKHPGLLLFVANCCSNVDWSMEEENDFLDEVVPQVERAIIFLTEFHKCVKNISSSVDSNLVREELQLSNDLLDTIDDFHKFPGFERFSAGVAGLWDDYNNAQLTTKSRRF